MTTKTTPVPLAEPTAAEHLATLEAELRHLNREDQALGLKQINGGFDETDRRRRQALVRRNNQLVINDLPLARAAAAGETAGANRAAADADLDRLIPTPGTLVEADALVAATSADLAAVEAEAATISGRITAAAAGGGGGAMVDLRRRAAELPDLLVAARLAHLAASAAQAALYAAAHRPDVMATAQAVAEAETALQQAQTDLAAARNAHAAASSESADLGARATDYRNALRRGVADLTATAGDEAPIVRSLIHGGAVVRSTRHGDAVVRSTIHGGNAQ